MDIGTGAYTEYSFGPDFAKMLMKNPQLLDMQRGHIHSHNSMAVFFSGTDTDEIVENSEHYNYYLSLIVNNRNEMTAKIAFRAKLMEGKRIYKFKNTKGVEVTSEFIESKEEEVVFIHNCGINKPTSNLISSAFRERYEEVRASKPVSTFQSSSNWESNYGKDKYHTKSTWGWKDTPTGRKWTNEVEDDNDFPFYNGSVTVQGDLYNAPERKYNYATGLWEDVKKKEAEKELRKETDVEVSDEDEEIDEKDIDYVKEFLIDILAGPYKDQTSSIEEAIVHIENLKKRNTPFMWKDHCKRLTERVLPAYNRCFIDDEGEAFLATMDVAKSVLKLKGKTVKDNHLIDDLLYSLEQVV